MFFKKKSQERGESCPNCTSEVNEKFSFCPYCGESLLDEAAEARNFGMLGRKDVADEEMIQQALGENLGITDRFIGSLFNSLMKNLQVQIKEVHMQEGAPEIKDLPNGIRIKIGAPQKSQHKKIVNRSISDKQLERLNALPRTEAKTSVRRFSDKVVYELAAPGVTSPEDIFISKLESGYEIKAIGKNKIYVNSLPLNLPLRGFALNEKGLIVEFGLR